MQRQMSELARDIVLKLDAPNKLAASYGLTDTQWAVLQIWPAFLTAVSNAKEDLGGPASTVERARRKAQLAVDEFVIMDMATISGDKKANNRDRIAAAQVLVEVGNMSSRAQIAAASASPAAGAAFSAGPLIQIVLPNGSQLGVGSVDTSAAFKAIEGEARVVTDNG